MRETLQIRFCESLTSRRRPARVWCSFFSPGGGQTASYLVYIKALIRALETSTYMDGQNLPRNSEIPHPAPKYTDKKKQSFLQTSFIFRKKGGRIHSRKRANECWSRGEKKVTRKKHSSLRGRQGRDITAYVRRKRLERLDVCEETCVICVALCNLITCRVLPQDHFRYGFKFALRSQIFERLPKCVIKHAYRLMQNKTKV